MSIKTALKFIKPDFKLAMSIKNTIKFKTPTTKLPKCQNQGSNKNASQNITKIGNQSIQLSFWKPQTKQF